MKYTDEELELLDAIEANKSETVSFDNEAIKAMASDTLEYLNEKKQISINLKRSDLDFIKQRAKDIGISYQSIIQSLVHNYSTNKLELKL
jgi:predicted DNA binding CopG/RHH family protein